MKKLDIKKAMLLASTLLLASVSQAATTTSTSQLDLLGFRASAFYADQSSSTFNTVLGSGAAVGSSDYTSLSGEIAWLPSYRLNDLFDAKLNLGATLLKSATQSDFVVADYELVIAYNLVSYLDIEAQGGAQTWMASNGGTQPVVGGNLAYNLPKASIFNQLFVGYSRYLLSGNNVNEVKLGVSVKL